MPPSPSLRYSPGKEPRGDSHKRGQSLESGVSFKEKDDDLALFNEMQSKDHDDFLLQSTDDLEDILSTKLKPFPDFKLAIVIPARGESNDLLKNDGDKNDYDWLLTPPDTPLFPSLDDEPTPVNLLHSGRPRSRPISISRSSTMDKSYRTKRGSASPQRLSPSPCSSTSTTCNAQGRPSSAPRSSPSPSLRNRSPTFRLSPPPVKPSTAPPRSSTPTPWQSSTGSGAALSSGMRGTSPIRSSRGSSSSPKVRAWQSNIPGFSLEAPPNLRTSLADRPVSYVRGSSPGSTNSRDSSSKFRRQSMSPTATRSISSSHSHEPDRFSTRSKVSVASSGDDDADSLLSAPISRTDHSVSKRGGGGFSNNRPTTFSKKPAKTFSPSSAPKRSFDTAIRQMDRRSPQNMFRQLLSSVPSTTFYGGKASSSQYSAILMNSSVTTSSNASSDQVTSGAPDTEGSEHNQDDVMSECGRVPYGGGNDEIVVFDKMDAVREDTGLEFQDQSPDFQLGEYHKAPVFESKPDETDELHRPDAAGLNCASSEVLYFQGDHVDGDMLLCSRCGCSYKVNELVENDVNLCSECKQKEGIVVNSVSSSRVDVPLDSSVPLANVLKEDGSSNASELYLAAHDSSDVMETGESASYSQIVPGEENEKESRTSYQEPSKGSFLDNSYVVSEGNASTPMLSDVQISGELMATPDLSADGFHELHSSNEDPLTKIDVAEGPGISVLLSKRSSSNIGPVIQGRIFTATAVSYDVQSYARESTSMRSSIGYGSISTSSSIDMSLRHAEMPMQRQLSGKKSDNSSKPESIGSSFSQNSSYISQGLALATSTREEHLDTYVGRGGHIVTEQPETPPDPTVALENTELLDREASFSRLTLLEEDNFHRNSRTNDFPAMELSTDVTQLKDGSFLSLAVDEEHNLHAFDNPLPEKEEINTDMDYSAAIPGSLIVDESTMPDGGGDQMELSEASHCDLATLPEIEISDCYPGSPGSQNDVITGDASQEPSAPSREVKDTSASASLSNDPEVVHEIIDGSTMMVESQEGRHARSFTLEEATDTILFCSSIIHNLAYEAACIAIEKEKENLVPVEVPRPTIPTAGKPSSDRNPHGRSPSKRASRAQKFKRRRKEMKTEIPSVETETVNANPGELTIGNVGLPRNVDSMKLESKCNCTIL